MTGFLIKNIYKYKLYVKYAIAGTTATAVDFVLLYFFHGLAGIQVVISASLAFVAAFFVSFYLQKFWTFRDNGCERIYEQMTMYLAVGLTNLLINALAIWLLVDFFYVWYILAQAISCSVLAVSNFLIYRYVIFKKKSGRINRHEIFEKA